MSDPVLEKLLAADSDLEAQEAQLSAQLNAIQAQRASLQSVLEIFDPEKTTIADKSVVAAPTPSAEKVVAPSPKTSVKAGSKPKAKVVKAKPTPSRKSVAPPKSTRRGWQKYMRDEHGQTPLPTIVSEILQAQPKKIFEIAEVVDAIVVKTIPLSDRKGARNRISNILAEGARKDQWHRHQSGCYSYSI
ncbi:MAG: hypothetical protein QNJ46_07130 [Leptolyngbyaceae cyanobacterium MO_188.B28]|nr:hypothetical protein [Leptolyngbyaceae cyanobacterium MO_188.B28]